MSQRQFHVFEITSGVIGEVAYTLSDRGMAAQMALMGVESTHFALWDLAIDPLSKIVDLGVWDDWTTINDEIALLDPATDAAEIASLQAEADDMYVNDLVIEYIPDSPGAEYEWDTETLRWVLTEAAAAIVSAQASIDQMVTTAAYMRCVGKLMIDPADTAAMADLVAMQDQIDAWQAIVDL